VTRKKCAAAISKGKKWAKCTGAFRVGKATGHDLVSTEYGRGIKGKDGIRRKKQQNGEDSYNKTA
jgi:hypothetical protein